MKAFSKGSIWVIAFCILSCQNQPGDKRAFEQTVEGKPTDLFFLRNKSGMKAAFTNYGGRLVSLFVPDKNGKLTNVVIGFDSVQQYKNSTEPYFGATIGRYGNRIAKGKFTLNGKPYQISINNSPNSLHGGKKGFQSKVWTGVLIGDTSVEFSYLSIDGEEGFPGNLAVKVIYSLTAANELRCEYEAATDETTILNLTNHAFFNLNGEGSGSITNHLLKINADQYTPVDSTLIPTGKLEQVKGTAFDFTHSHAIGENINDGSEQLKYGKGYDHNFVLNGTGIKPAATVIGEKSGIMMEILTSEPGLQFYCGNFMQSKNKLRKGTDDFRTAFCLETQHFPDSPNEPGFPTTILIPGEKYYSISYYKFSAH